MTRPVSALRVVELADGLPVAYCGRQFAEYGSDVVRLEPPGGSELRRSPPIAEGHGGKSMSLLWQYATANKSLKSYDPGALDDVAALAASADVLLTDWSRGRLRGALDPGELVRASPRLVVLSVSDFGTTGPYASFQGTDLVLQALTGYMSFNGEPGRPPLRAPANIVPYAVGVSAFVGVLAALKARNATGRGQLVEVCAMEAVASLVQYTWTEYFGRPASRGGVAAPMLECADGYLFFDYRYHAVHAPLLRALRIDESAVPQDPSDFEAFFGGHTKRWNAEELFRTMSSLGAVAAFVQTPHDLPANDHLRARRFFRQFGTDAATAVFPGPPVREGVTRRVAPEPARDFSEWRQRHEDEEEDVPHQTPLPAPLNGVRVLDMTQAWLGPYATMLLADLGADVIKVESRGRPDVWRVLAEVPPCARPQAHKWNTSHWFNSVNRNKRSFTLDLSDERGRALLRRLAQTADVVAENYTPRVMENFGLTCETLREINPRAVMVSFSGYGRGGPYGDFKANGASIETISGWVSLFGYGDERPLNLGHYPVDPVAGLHMAAAAIVGLLEADATGRGQAIEGAMMETAVAYIGEELMLAAAAPAAGHPVGNRHRDMAPHGVFRCAGDDSWVAIAVRDDADWRALCAVVGDPSLADDRYLTADGRREHEDEIEAKLASWTGRCQAGEVMRLLQRSGVPAGVVHNTQQALEDEHLDARDWFQRVEHIDVGTHRYYGFPWSFSDGTLEVHRPPPRLGEHSEEILGSELGMHREEIDELVEAGITRAALEYVPRAHQPASPSR